MEIIITIVGFWLILAISYAVYFYHSERSRKQRSAEFREEAGMDYLPLGSFTGGPFEAPARPTPISRTVPEFVSRAGTQPAAGVSLVRRPDINRAVRQEPPAVDIEEAEDEFEDFGVEEAPAAPPRPASASSRKPAASEPQTSSSVEKPGSRRAKPSQTKPVHSRVTRSYRRRQAS